MTTYQIDQTESKYKPKNLEYIDSNGNYSMLNVMLLKSSYKYTKKKLYPKIQDSQANFASVFILLVGFFGIATAAYFSRAYPIVIANELYEFDIQQSQQKGRRKIRYNSKKDELTERSHSKKGGTSTPRTEDKIKLKQQGVNTLVRR